MFSFYFFIFSEFVIFYLKRLENTHEVAKNVIYTPLVRISEMPIIMDIVKWRLCLGIQLILLEKKEIIKISCSMQ